MEDDIEKPSCKILYRQSSLETRLSPVHLSEESSSESEEEGQNNTPNIVDFKTKSGTSGIDDAHKIDFKKELEKRLVTPPFPITNSTSTDRKDEGKSNTDRKDGGKSVESYENHPKKNLVSKTKFNEELKQKLERELQKNKEGKEKTLETDQSHQLLKNVTPTKPTISPKPLKQQKNTDIINEVKNNNVITGDGIIDVNDISLVGTLKALNLPRKEAEEERVGAGVGDGCQNKKQEMATATRPKSPRPVAITGEKDESFWDKLGTLGRKKRIKEVQEVQAEGKYAIDSPGCPAAPIIPPEEYNLDDNERRCMIDKRAYDDPKFNDLLNVLKEWINDELASQRIIVQDLAEDLYDGQVLQKLLEKLTGDKLDVPEVTQSEEGQKQKLSVVLSHFNQVLGIQRISHDKWSVEAIHSKNIVGIIHLLVALARHFRPPVRLPEHVSVDMVVVQKVKGILNPTTVRESLTKAYDDVGMRCERDAFDTLFDHAPDKLQVVKKSLVTFVNKHLNKMNFEVTEIESQFHDGVYLIMLMGLLEGFFVPHYSFHLTPHEFDQKVHNVNFAFELMEEVGLQKPKARPEDLVNMDLKSTLRVLYNLFLKYKTIL